MAALCVELHMSPAEYWNLRVDEYNALLEELTLRQKHAAKVARGG